MPVYRCLLLRETGEVMAYDTFEAASDDEAVEQARRWAGVSPRYEVWCGSRVVAEVGLQRGPAG